MCKPSDSTELDLNDVIESLETTELELKRFVYRGDKFYRKLSQPKKSGGTRSICAPSDDLKELQRRISKVLLSRLKPHDACTGFRKGKSILTNSVPHVGKDFVLNIDIKDFFPSIAMPRVIGLFRTLGCDQHASHALAKIVTYEGKLPQGAPSSPDVANLVCRTLDKRISGFCKARGFTYTRYCDDITISGAGDGSGIMSFLGRIIREEGFAINDSKTRVRSRSQRQMVTGIVVNSLANLPREDLRRMRAIFKQAELNPEQFKQHRATLAGRVAFAEMILGGDHAKLQKYREILEKLK